MNRLIFSLLFLAFVSPALAQYPPSPGQSPYFSGVKTDQLILPGLTNCLVQANGSSPVSCGSGGGGGGGITIGSTSITGGVNGYFLYDNAGQVGETPSSNIIIGSSPIISGADGYILYDNSGIVGNLAVGSGVPGVLATATGASGGIAPISGTPVSGNCAKWGASGVLADQGAPCSASGAATLTIGGNTVVGATNGYVLYNNSGVLGAEAAPPAAIVNGITTVTGATNGYILYNNSGVVGAEAAPPASIVNGSTTVTGATNGYVLYNNSGVVGFEAPSSSMVVGSSTITGGSTGRIEYNNGGTLGEYPVGSGVSSALSFIVNGNGGLPTVSGSIVTGNCLKWGPGVQDAGAGCGSGVPGARGTTYMSTGVSTAPTWARNGINVESYGAKCDGVTDDTTAISNAFAAAGSGGRVVFPPGKQCEVSGSGANIFSITLPIVIDCQYGIIDYIGSSNSTNLISFRPTGTGNYFPFRVTQCQFNTHNHIADLIVFDTTASTLTEITQCEVDHIWDFFGHGAGGGYSVYVNNSPSNTNGGTYHCDFHDSIFQGLFFNSAGDSLRVYNNILMGPTYGVWANLITGAAGLIISGNNVSAACPLLIDKSAGNTVVTDNEFEQQVTNICPNQAVVDFRGTTALPMVTFTGNSVISLAGTGNSYPLYLGNVLHSYIESNILTSAGAAVPCIQVTAGATTVIGSANVLLGCTTTAVNGAGIIHTVTVHASYP